MARQKPSAEFDPERVRDVSEAVYRNRLEQESAGAVQRMIKKDGDKGVLLRSRAGSYDTLSRSYMRVLNDKE